MTPGSLDLQCKVKVSPILLYGDEACISKVGMIGGSSLPGDDCFNECLRMNFKVNVESLFTFFNDAFRCMYKSKLGH